MDNVRFIHLRLAKPRGFKLSDAYQRYDYLAKGGMTVAYHVQEVSPDLVYVKFHIAICNAKDHYNKRIGRAISYGRLCAGADAAGDVGQPVSGDWYANLVNSSMQLYQKYYHVPSDAELVTSSRRPIARPKLHQVIRTDGDLLDALRV